jgi:hypothetical protein
MNFEIKTSYTQYTTLVPHSFLGSSLMPDYEFKTAISKYLAKDSFCVDVEWFDESFLVTFRV